MGEARDGMMEEICCELFADGTTKGKRCSGKLLRKVQQRCLRLDLAWRNGVLWRHGTGSTSAAFKAGHQASESTACAEHVSERFM